MYESPIKLLQQQMQTQIVTHMEGEVLKTVLSYGIDVDKEELLKALKYDRDQYDKGYEEGYRKAVEDFMDRIREPIFALDNGDACPNDRVCPELVECVDCKINRVKRIILEAREEMIGGEDD
jgi:hypothetical protein